MSPNVLTYPNHYYTMNFSRRLKLIEEYKVNMLTYLTQRFPNEDEAVLKKKMNAIIAKQYKPSILKYFSLPSVGNVSAKSGDLLDITNELNHDILTPYGTTYCPVAERKSLFSGYIEDNQNMRKLVKHDMFLAEARGDKDTAAIKNLSQMNIKININALSGVMLSTVAFRSAINYNSVTATARFGAMTAYSVIELSMASNYYLYDEDRAINWIIRLLRIFPGEDALQDCISTYGLVIPTVEKVFSDYAKQVLNYSRFSKNEQLEQLINSLTDMQRSFVYYAVNIKRIFQDNAGFKVLLKDMIDDSLVPLIDGDIPSFLAVPDDIIRTFTVVVCSKEIGKLTLDDVEKSHPELRRKLYSTYIYIEKQFGQLSKLFETLILLPILPSETGIHQNMIRRTVLLSDTDSVLFTNKNWIEWFFGEIVINDESSKINAAMISLASKLLEHSFAYMSSSMNIDNDNTRLIRIKNEFMYDVFLRTAISKHYSAYARYREGFKQDPYKLDLKGKNFKGSDLCKETTKFVKVFIRSIFDKYIESKQINPEELIIRTISFEQRIKRSIDDGEVTFLTQQPIKLKKDYDNPVSSRYIYYELWQAIFAKKYGDLNLPQKTREVPIMTVALSDSSNLNHIRAMDHTIYENFKLFLQKHSKRKFDRVLIPTDMKLPEELRAISNYRKVCASNCYSLKLILESLNIVNYPNTKSITLFSDTYPHLLQELTNAYQERLNTEIENYSEKDDYEDEEDEEYFDTTDDADTWIKDRD